MKKKKKGSASIITSIWYSQNEASQKAALHQAENKQDSTEATMIFPRDTLVQNLNLHVLNLKVRLCYIPHFHVINCKRSAKLLQRQLAALMQMPCQLYGTLKTV